MTIVLIKLTSLMCKLLNKLLLLKLHLCILRTLIQILRALLWQQAIFDIALVEYTLVNSVDLCFIQIRQYASIPTQACLHVTHLDCNPKCHQQNLRKCAGQFLSVSTPYNCQLPL